MEEESSSDTPGEPSGAGGDASQFLHLRETESGVSLSSKLDKEAQNAINSSTTPNGKRSSATQDAIRSESRLSSQDNLVGVEDVEAGVKNLEASAIKSSESRGGGEEMEAASYCREKRVRLSPKLEEDSDGDALVKEKMYVDPDDSILCLDQMVEKGVSSNIKQDCVQVSTVLSPSAMSSEDSEKSLPGDNKPKAGTCEGSSASGGVGLGESSGLIATLAENGCDSLEDRCSNGEESKAVAPEELPSLSEDLSDSDDDEDEGAGVVNSRLLTARQRGILQRRRLIARRMGRRRQLSSSSESLVDLDSDDDGGSGGDDNTQTGKESDNDEEIQQVIQGVVDKPVPKPNWFALRELRKREYCSADRLASSWFRERVQSSLHMVRKLVTVERMKAHEGCVNALSFNRIGEEHNVGLPELDYFYCSF